MSGRGGGGMFSVAEPETPEPGFYWLEPNFSNLNLLSPKLIYCQCCGFKYIQFGSGSRDILPKQVLKEKI